MNKHQLLIAALIAVATSSTHSVAANSEYRSNGLALIKLDTSTQQQNPLSVVASINFPQSISTVGQAINYTLFKAGYEIESRTHFDKQTRIVLSKDIPIVHRKFEFSTVEQIVQSLLGSSFTIKFDDVERTVSINYKSVRQDTHESAN